jgi:hypothetical protein
MADDDGDDDDVGVYDFYDSLREVIIASDPTKREVLRRTIDAWSKGNDAETFFWAIGPQAPTMLYQLITEIDMSCEPDAASKPRPVIRLVDRKPQRSA